MELRTATPIRPNFTVVVPTLNEVQNIDRLVTEIMHSGGDSLKEIIVVDDGSTDGTQQQVRSWEGRAPVRLLCREAKRGLAGAVLEGARAARSEVIVVMDGDLSHPAAALPRLVNPIAAGEEEMMIGSRYVAGGTTPDWPVFRRLLSRLAALLAWPLTDVRDSLSGFFAVRRELLLALPTEVAGFKIGLEILVREGAGLRVREVPIAFKDRQMGQSKMSGHVGATYLRQLLGFFLARLQRLPTLSRVVLTVWCLAVLVIFARTAASPHRNTVFATYEAAGQSWRAAGSIYTTFGGFVYSPLVAALFAPFSALPEWLSNLLWRCLNLTVYTAAIWWWLRRGMHEGIPRARYGLVFLLLLPLSLGNFNNGQVNPMVIGLLMIAVVGARVERWWLAAFCIAMATYLKMYPIVLGMLLAVMFPKRFTWRFVLALLVLGACSFLLQRPSYVLDQYQAWWHTRISDHRHFYALRLAPRDLWLLLHDLHLSVPESAYQVLQVCTGGSIAVYAFIRRSRGESLNALLVGVFFLAVSWMLLLGPATESATYILLAPVVVLEVVNLLQNRLSLVSGLLLFGSLALLLLSLGINSFTHANRNPHAMVMQPLAALLFVLYLARTRLAFGRASSATG